MNEEQTKRINDLRNKPNLTLKEQEELKRLEKVEAQGNDPEMDQSENPENSEEANQPEGENA